MTATTTPEDKNSIAKIVDDLMAMRRDEAKGVMVMANSDDTMFEDCIRRLKEISAAVPELRTLSGETPRTDAELARIFTDRELPPVVVRLESLARQLERELAEANKDKVALSQALDIVDTPVSTKRTSSPEIPDNSFDTPARSTRGTPSDAVLEAWLRADDVWCEPSPDVMESGVVVEPGLTEDDCTLINADAIDRARESWSNLQTALSTSGMRSTEQQIADMLVTLELARFRSWDDGLAGRKVDSSPEYDKVRAFLISLAPDVVLPEHEQSPKSCPHADPFVYCETCKVSPCPLGLDAARSATQERKDG